MITEISESEQLFEMPDLGKENGICRSVRNLQRAVLFFYWKKNGNCGIFSSNQSVVLGCRNGGLHENRCFGSGRHKNGVRCGR